MTSLLSAVFFAINGVIRAELSLQGLYTLYLYASGGVFSSLVYLVSCWLSEDHRKSSLPTRSPLPREPVDVH